MSMQPITASSIVPVADPFAATAAEVLDGLDSSAEGLSGSEAARRVQQFGANRLPAPARAVVGPTGGSSTSTMC